MGLSERKSKQRIQLDPQNQTWSQDSSRFGLKLMKQMGFQQGKGLGKDQSGIRENIMIKRNVESNGVGCNLKTQDNWLENQFQFDNLLKSLTTTTTTTTIFKGVGVVNGNDGIDGIVGEEKKKVETRATRTISSRHSHRKKFITQKKMVVGETVVGDILGIGKVVESSEIESTVETSTNTTTSKSSNNLQEYFAKKMAEKGLTFFGGVLTQSKSFKFKDDDVVSVDDKSTLQIDDLSNNDAVSGDNNSVKDQTSDYGSKKRKAIDIDCVDNPEIKESKKKRKKEKKSRKESKKESGKLEKKAKKLAKKLKKSSN